MIHYGTTRQAGWSPSRTTTRRTVTPSTLDRVTTETVANPDPVCLHHRLRPAGRSPTSFSATIGGVPDFLRTYQYDVLGQMTHIGQTGQPNGNPVTRSASTCVRRRRPLLRSGPLPRHQPRRHEHLAVRLPRPLDDPVHLAPRPPLATPPSWPPTPGPTTRRAA